MEWKLQEAVNTQREGRAQRVRQWDTAEGLKAMVTAGLDGWGVPGPCRLPLSQEPRGVWGCRRQRGLDLGLGACRGSGLGYSAVFPHSLTVALLARAAWGTGSSEPVLP